ncbi:MAG: hypothetical protein ACJAYG_002282 [Oceanicoccus sp.]|jgi:hypothetical protein
MNTANSNRVFTQVDYNQFRQHLDDICTKNIKGKGFETTIFDDKGDIQAIVHAASIDSDGRCYPAEYYIRSNANACQMQWPLAA